MVFPRPSARMFWALIVSQCFAVSYWLLALWIRSLGIVPVWFDQASTFTRNYPLASPYGFSDSNFNNPPWAAPVFAAFSGLPLSVATLVQLCLYFAILTAIIFKFGGGLRAALITFTSFIMLDSVIELNVEWLVYLGLLVPPAFSGPFLLTKPQLAFGYWLGLRRLDIVHAVIVLLVVLLVSLLIWGLWPPLMLEAIQTNVTGPTARNGNIAPLSVLSLPLSLGVGAALSWMAIRKHDPALGILAGLFFVPYISLYSLTLPFAIVAVRWPRWALLISVVIWLVYGGVIARYFLLA